MEQCIQMLAQAIQSGQLDPQMPIGSLVQQMMGQSGQEQVQEDPGGLGGPVAQPSQEMPVG